MEATFTHEGAGGYACNSLMLYTTPIIEGVTLYIASSSVVMGICVCVCMCVHFLLQGGCTSSCIVVEWILESREFVG